MGQIWLIWLINDAFCGLTRFQWTNISPYMLRLKPENLGWNSKLNTDSNGNSKLNS